MKEYIIDILIAINCLWNIAFIYFAFVLWKDFFQERSYPNPSTVYWKLVWGFFITGLLIVVFMPREETLRILFELAPKV